MAVGGSKAYFSLFKKAHLQLFTGNVGCIASALPSHKYLAVNWPDQPKDSLVQCFLTRVPVPPVILEVMSHGTVLCGTPQYLPLDIKTRNMTKQIAEGNGKACFSVLEKFLLSEPFIVVFIVLCVASPPSSDDTLNRLCEVVQSRTKVEKHSSFRITTMH